MNRILLTIGAALLMLSCGGGKNLMEVSVQNPTGIDRENEIVEVDLADRVLRATGNGGSGIIVVDGDNRQVPCQLITNGGESAVSIIFPVSLKASEEKSFRIRGGTPEEFAPMVYGRLVPERKDDFTWENNRVAYRIYGPALQATGEVSNGMDIWVKSTEAMVIDKWYRDDLAGVKSYHRDHGEGVDFYKVGPTLGLGMTAPLHDGKLCLGKNFTEAEILDIGPLRIAMKFKYAPYKVGEREVAETRIISLDAYEQLSKVVNIFDADVPELTLATGIVTPGDGSEPTFGDTSGGIIAYEVPADANYGTIYTGAVNAMGYEEIKRSGGHFMGVNRYETGKPYTYHAGGGWSRHGFTGGFGQWTDYLKNLRIRLDNPLKVEVK